HGQQAARGQQRGRQRKGTRKWGHSRQRAHMPKSLERRQVEIAVRAIDLWADQLAESHLPQLVDRPEQEAGLTRPRHAARTNHVAAADLDNLWQKVNSEDEATSGGLPECGEKTSDGHVKERVRGGACRGRRRSGRR